MMQIEEITLETPNKITLFFKENLAFKPGQFIMLWLPGVDEKPFTLSYLNKNRFGITIEKKGEFTKQIFKLKEKDSLGIRGPFGNGFKIHKSFKHAAVIGGGCGQAPLAPLIDLLLKKGIKVSIFQGAKTKTDILFLNRFKNVKYFTDDGSFGTKGFLTNYLDQIKLNFDIVYSCGPEEMMKKISDICFKNKIKCQISLERYMKCAIGICASCMCGTQRVCIDGPVFDTKKMNL